MPYKFIRVLAKNGHEWEPINKKEKNINMAYFWEHVGDVAGQRSRGARVESNHRCPKFPLVG